MIRNGVDEEQNVRRLVASTEPLATGKCRSSLSRSSTGAEGFRQEDRHLCGTHGKL